MNAAVIEIYPFESAWAVRFGVSLLATFDTPAGAVAFARSFRDRAADGDPPARICVRFQGGAD